MAIGATRSGRGRALRRRGDGARGAARWGSTGCSRRWPTSTTTRPTRSSTSGPSARIPTGLDDGLRLRARRASAGGVLTSAKHFPGHGDSSVDSHLVLPTIPGDRARLDAVELAPFRAAIAAGVDSVMFGHLRVPALDPSGAPATLSPLVATKLLREEMGFRGLVVTDAMEMKGVGGVWMGEAAVEAVRAGADVVLLPPDARVAIQSLVRAVDEGPIPSRGSTSRRRVLAAKARLGLHRDRTVDRAGSGARWAGPRTRTRAERSPARRSPWCATRAGSFRSPSRRRCASCTCAVERLGEPGDHRGAGARAHRARHRRGEPAAGAAVPPATPTRSSPRRPGRPRRPRRSPTSWSRRSCASPRRRGRRDGPVARRAARAAGGAGCRRSSSPTATRTSSPSFPTSRSTSARFSWESSSQRAAIAALLGESPIGGRLPVTIPGLAPFGQGSIGRGAT